MAKQPPRGIRREPEVYPRNPARHVLPILLVLLVAACGGNSKGAAVTVTVTAGAGGTTTSQVNSVPASTQSGEHQPTKTVPLNTPVVDDGVRFKVTSATSKTSLSDGYTVYHPQRGGRFVVLRIVLTNLGQTAVTPLCGGNGAVLGDPKHRNFEIDSEHSIDIEGSAGICTDLQPGLPTAVSVVFTVPYHAQITYVALWNGDYSGKDPQGATFNDVTL